MPNPTDAFSYEIHAQSCPSKQAATLSLIHIEHLLLQDLHKYIENCAKACAHCPAKQRHYCTEFSQENTEGIAKIDVPHSFNGDIFALMRALQIVCLKYIVNLPPET